MGGALRAGLRESFPIARRNITKEQRKHLIGMQYKLKKKGVGERGKEKISQNDTFISTAQRIADEHGVSRNTVIRAGKFVEDLDKLPEEEQKLAGIKVSK